MCKWAKFCLFFCTFYLFFFLMGGVTGGAPAYPSSQHVDALHVIQSHAHSKTRVSHRCARRGSTIEEEQRISSRNVKAMSHLFGCVWMFPTFSFLYYLLLKCIRTQSTLAVLTATNGDKNKPELLVSPAAILTTFATLYDGSNGRLSFPQHPS